MKHLDKTLLNNVEITWAKSGESLPLCQGMALDTLINEYPSKKGRNGWMLWSERMNYQHPDEILPEACYYLLERNVEGMGQCTVAFKENGDNIEGYAIFK